MAAEPEFHGPKDYLDLARSPEATPDRLRELARSPYNFVREAVAQHPAAPADALIAVLPIEITGWNDGATLVALVRNPNTPQAVLCSVPKLVLPRLAVRDDHRAFEAGVALAQRDDSPEDVLLAMVADARATTEFRKVIARETTHTRLLEELRSDRSERAAEQPLDVVLRARDFGVCNAMFCVTSQSWSRPPAAGNIG